jgi:HlyD family secretion protein
MKNLWSKLRSVNLNQILVVLAILGLLGAIRMVLNDQKTVPVAQPVTKPSVSPFTSFIAGLGIIEAESENIAIGTLVGGTVEQVFVTPGQLVKKGSPLFSLDTRSALADVQLRTAQLETAKASLKQANANLKSAEDEFNLIKKVKDTRAYTKEEFVIRENKVNINRAALEAAFAAVSASEAQLAASQTNLRLYTIVAPIDCTILQINIHPGEYAPANSLNTPLILAGSTTRPHVRVNIDENDAWRFDKNSPAVAFLRGNVQFKANLKFEYIEPYVIPKKSLTGDPTEQVDVRVLQVVYSYDPKDLPAYLGQQVDVYIEAKELDKDAKYGGPMQVSQ